MQGKQRRQQEVRHRRQQNVSPYSRTVHRVHMAGHGVGSAHLFHGPGDGRVRVHTLRFQFGGLVFQVALQLQEYFPLLRGIQMEAFGQRGEVVCYVDRHLLPLTARYGGSGSIMASMAWLNFCHSLSRSARASWPFEVIR